MFPCREGGHIETRHMGQIQKTKGGMLALSQVLELGAWGGKK